MTKCATDVEQGNIMSGKDVLVPKGDELLPACRICGTKPTVKSHLLPAAFVKEIYYEGSNNEKHMIIHNEKNYKEHSSTGRFERGILCKDCDNILGKYENAAVSLFRKLRAIKISKMVDNEVYIPKKVYPFKVAAVNDIVRFACGILWKYASLPSSYPAHIDIGRYKEMLQDICFKGSEIPDEIDVFLERDISAHAHRADPNEVYYYSTPSFQLIEGLRMGWFNAGGFFVYVLMDERGPSRFATRQCWLKGRKNCYFNVNIRSLKHYEEIARSMRIAQPDLLRLNKKIDIPTRYIE